MTLLTRAVAGIVTHPWRALALALVPLVVLALPAGSVPTDNSLAVWFVDDDPALVAYRSFLAEFGNDEVVVIAFAPPDDPLDSASLALQARTAERLDALPGIDRVLSVPGILAEAGIAGHGAAVSGGPEPALRSLGLLGDDGTVAMMAWLEPREDMDAARGRVLDAIAAVLDSTLVAAGVDPKLAGTGVLYEGLNRQTSQDGAVFLGLAVVVIAVLLRLILGSLRAAALALSAPLAATLATTGLIGWTGGSLNVVMAALPALILVIGVADAIHIFMEWFRARRAAAPADPEDRRRLAADVVARMAVPCLFTSLTTALGFLALASSRMAVIRGFGLYAAAGVLLVWALVIVVMAAGLSLLDIEPPARRLGGRLSGPLGRLGDVVVRRRAAVLIGFAGVAALLAIGIGRVRVDTHTIGLLPDDHPVVEDSRWIEARLGRYTPLEFVIEAREGSVLRPALLERIGEWAAAAGGRSDVGRTLGITDMLADPGEGSAYVTEDRTRARMTAFVPMGTAREFEATAAALVEIGDEVLGDDAEIRATGYLPLYVRIIDYTVSSTVVGLGLAFAGVFIVLMLLLRSVPLVLAAIPANLFPIATVFGVMGWAGIPLDIATATVGAIVLGIAVDDTVHFLHRYGETGLASATLAEAGPGMVLTSVVLVLGLGVLLAAGSVSIVYFGLLITIAVAAALVADLLLLPALLPALVPGRSRTP